MESYNYSNATSNSTTDNSWSSPIVSFALGLFYIILMLWIVAGNFLVVLGYYKFSHLQTMTNTFIVHLAVADLLVGICLPYHIYVFLQPQILRNEYACLFRYASMIVPQDSSVSCLILLTFDRYMSIAKPYSYMYIMTSKRVMAVFTFLWLMCLTSGLFVPLGWHNPLEPDVSERDACDLTKVLKWSYFVYMKFPAFSLALVLIFIMYMHIFHIARSHSKQIQAQGISTGNYSATEMKTKMKLTKMAALVMGVFLCSWLPFIVFTGLDLVAKSRSTQPSSLVVNARALSSILALANSGMNPVIYAVKDRNLNNAFRKILHLKITNSSI